MRALCFNIRGRNYSRMAPEPRIPRKLTRIRYAMAKYRIICIVHLLRMYTAAINNVALSHS